MTPTTIPGLSVERCIELSMALDHLGSVRGACNLLSAAKDAFAAGESYAWIAIHPTDPRCAEVLQRAWSGKPPPEDGP